MTGRLIEKPEKEHRHNILKSSNILNQKSNVPMCLSSVVVLLKQEDHDGPISLT